MPLRLHGNIFRIFFGSYDSHGRGRIFSLDLDILKPQSIQNLQTKPLVDIGNVGFFDDNGVIPSAIITTGEELYLYTIGFSLKNKIIFDAATGLAISKDKGKTFQKLPGSIIDRGVDDPCFAASPSVLKDNEGWRMWYVSCDRWEPHKGGYRHFYNIKHRQSEDGIYWDSKTTTCINYASKFEYAISRPSVIQETSGQYSMWYSFRAQEQIETYRIGYAESKDGLTWVRQDQDVGIDVSETGWDSEMICYPCVFEHKEIKYMLYNGNGYGRTGFGLAVLEKD